MWFASDEVMVVMIEIAAAAATTEPKAKAVPMMMPAIQMYIIVFTGSKEAAFPATMISEGSHASKKGLHWMLLGGIGRSGKLASTA